MPKVLNVKELPYYIETPIAHSFFQNGKYSVVLGADDFDITFVEGIIERGTFLGKDYNQRPIDLYLPLLDWYCHCINIYDLYPILRKIESDLANVCVVFYRYQDVLSTERNLKQSYFLKADLEFFFYNIRSLFDLSQFFYKCLWKKSQNSQGKSPAKSLPDSFAKMTLSGDKLLTLERIKEKYSIPELIARVYVKYGKIFQDCRDIRDQVAHQGRDIETIFIKDEKVLVDVTQYPFNKFGCWKKEEIDKNNMGELLILLQFLLRSVIHYLKDLAIALNKSYSTNSLIHSGWKMYVCHPLFPILREKLNEDCK